VANPNSVRSVSGAEASPPPVIQAEVLVYHGEEFIAKYSITHGDYVIGRDSGAQVLVEVDGVSRHHARLSFQGYELSLEDLDSANGVFIEGVQVTLPTRVRPDQQVEIGSARLFIRLKAESGEMLATALWDPDLGLAPVRALLDGRRYKVQGAIGGGGMGIVLQARDLRIRRSVAMKVIKTSAQFSRENVLRFVDEAQLTGQLQHPNIVPVYELGLDDQEEVFYTMKFVRGKTLDEILAGLRRGDEVMLAKYPLTALLAVFQKICDGVAYAHSMGVVHRDLKPDNVMVGEYGEVLVMDWGLAKKIAHGMNDEHLGDLPEPPPVDLRNFETLHGLIVGTPPYIAPEAARGELEQIDPRSDIFVLGAILYAILTLRPPFPGREFGELIEQIVSGKFVHPSSYNQPAKATRTPSPPPPGPDGLCYPLSHLPGGRVPEGLAATVMKAMAYTIADRYQTVEELQSDVTAWQGGFAPKAERAGLRRQLFLWAGRHKRNVAMIAIFAVIFHVAVIWLFLSLKHERDRARASEGELARALKDLQGAAPLFFNEAEQLVRRRDFDHALDSIERAIRQTPNSGEYHQLRGNILQVLLRWDDAVEAYENALDRNPKLTNAKENLELTKTLLAAAGEEHDPEEPQIKMLQLALTKQGRPQEAASLNEKLSDQRPPPGKSLRAEIETDPQLAPLREILTKREFRGRFAREKEDGTYVAKFRGMPYYSLEPFFAVSPPQISGLMLDEVKIPDLTVVERLQLRALSLAGCRTVSNLSPLSKMTTLKRLNLARTNVNDLTPLANLPLVELILEDCPKLTDLKTLGDLTTLETLVLPPQAKDIAFLRDHKTLKYLSYHNATQPVAEFWKEVDGKK
jgi:serine/threonine protein kinase